MKEAWIKHNKAVGFCVSSYHLPARAGWEVNVSGKPGDQIQAATFTAFVTLGKIFTLSEPQCPCM